MDKELRNGFKEIQEHKKELFEFDFNLKTQSNSDSHCSENGYQIEEKSDIAQINEFIQKQFDLIVNNVDDLRKKLKRQEEFDFKTSTPYEFLNQFRTMQIEYSENLQNLRKVSYESAVVSAGSIIEQKTLEAQIQMIELHKQLELEREKSKDFEDKFTDQQNLNRRYLTRINFLDEGLESAQKELQTCKETSRSLKTKICSQDLEIENLKKSLNSTVDEKMNSELKFKSYVAKEEDQLCKINDLRNLAERLEQNVLKFEKENATLKANREAENKIQALENDKQKLTERLKKMEENTLKSMTLKEQTLENDNQILMERLKKMEENSLKLMALKRRVTTAKEDSAKIGVFGQLCELLPVTNLEAFIDLETKLGLRDEFSRAVEFFVRMHLKDVDNAEVGMYKILPLMIKKEVQLLYCIYNVKDQENSFRSGKFDFSTTKTYNVLKNAAHPDIKLERYETRIKFLDEALDKAENQVQIYKKKSKSLQLTIRSQDLTIEKLRKILGSNREDKEALERRFKSFSEKEEEYLRTLDSLKSLQEKLERTLSQFGEENENLMIIRRAEEKIKSLEVANERLVKKCKRMKKIKGLEQDKLKLMEKLKKIKKNAKTLS